MQQFLSPLLTPLARLAIARGWRFGDVVERLRHAFIEAARDEAGADATDSRISVMTGLQRRDVARLRAESGAGAAEHATTDADPPNHLARIVARWLADPALDGAPLPRRGEGSFDALAASVHRDVHPRTFLDRLVAAGTVREEGDTVILIEQAYRPLAGSDAALRYLAQNVGDHLAASVHNVVRRPRFLERAVHYDGLGPAAIAELDALWRAQAGAALAAVNARAAVLQAVAATAPGGAPDSEPESEPEIDPAQGRFRAGAYFFDTLTPPSPRKESGP